MSEVPPREEITEVWLRSIFGEWIAPGWRERKFQQLAHELIQGESGWKPVTPRDFRLAYPLGLYLGLIWMDAPRKHLDLAWERWLKAEQAEAQS